MPWGVKISADRQERWIEMHPLEREPLSSCANTPVCRDPVCHSSSALLSRFKEIYTVVKVHPASSINCTLFVSGRRTWEVC